jgi:hypothetical protein
LRVETSSLLVLQQIFFEIGRVRRVSMARS